MIINETFAIGLMSGTSLDGIDLVYVYFKEEFSIISSTIIKLQTLILLLLMDIQFYMNQQKELRCKLVLDKKLQTSPNKK